MKTNFLIIAGILLITACGQKTQDQTATREVDSLMSIINEREASINEFLAVNAEIEKNLDSIATKEGAIRMSVSKENELKGSYKDRLNADIEAINTLMKENREKINQLTAKLNNSKAKGKQDEQMIQHLNDRLAGKDAELAYLNERLTALNTQVAKLETSVSILAAKNDEQAQTIAKQESALHTAYFIIDNSKTLKEKNIINKTGGLLGIGRTSQIDPDVNTADFTQIDYTTVTDINVDSKNVKIITAHPSDSYTLNKDQNSKVTTIHISDPEKFWHTSKYLVVVKD